MSWADALADYLPSYYRVNHERIRVIFEAQEHMNSYDITLLLHNINYNNVYSQFVVNFNDGAIECRSFVTLDGTLAQDHIKYNLDGQVSMVFTIAKSSSEAIDNAVEDIQLVKNTCQRFPWSQTDETPS